ncbi:MAG: acyl carrier protein [Spirochaetales bacterium]|nr:acyl carrier protein [Spirochaetales bacterium]
MDELFEKLKKIIVEKLEVEEAKVLPESKIREDLNADSLDTYELLYAIEEEMGITIPEDKASEFEKVGDVLAYLRTQQK